MQENYTIIDWSSHLPGPYATHQLAKLGFKVLKPIKRNKLMPFQRIASLGLEPLNIFNFWFESFNIKKEIIYYDNESELEQIFKQANGIITNKIKLPFQTQAVITRIISSHQDNYPRHDINALAESGLLNSQSSNLPILPWAGIELANKVVQTHLRQLLINEKKVDVALDQSARELSITLEQGLKQPHLHTGAFPCYRLYELQDGVRVALGAVEEKFWGKFCEYFQLSFSSSDRFDLTGAVALKIERKLKTLSSHDLTIKGETREFCLNILR